MIDRTYIITSHFADGFTCKTASDDETTRWNGAGHATQAAEFYRNPTAVISDEF